ncbi:MAG: ferritin family protein [Geopsychrobacter sp.]|nr:ferritin family protein [Geopsychrobacter sp.]
MSEGVCYTFEAAIEKAIEMEENGFRCYLRAISILNNKHAREVLRDSALDEMRHKQELEKALLNGTMEGSVRMQAGVQTMNLNYMLEQKALSPDADVRQALAYAIHLEKEAIDFYQKMIDGCQGAPMVPVFQQLLNDETRHLRQLEDMYEEHFLTEN